MPEPWKYAPGVRMIFDPGPASDVVIAACVRPEHAPQIVHSGVMAELLREYLAGWAHTGLTYPCPCPLCGRARTILAEIDAAQAGAKGVPTP